MLRLTRALWVVSCGCFVCGCSQPLTNDECNELLDHYTERLAHAKNPDLPDPEIERLKAEARQRAAEDPKIGSCSPEVSRRQWECAMKAPSVDEMERCLL